MPNKPIKQKKCKACGDAFTPFSTTQTACGLLCSLDLVERTKAKKARKELSAGRERLRSKSDHHKIAQAAFNAFIRARDVGKPCISCGKNSGCKMNAGHYYSVGARPELRYDEDNCSLQCEKCNSWLSGNIAEYRPNLIKKIGQERMDRLEGNHTAKHYTIDDIKAITKTYRQKLKELK